MRVRTDLDANYRAVFFNGKTIRQRIDSDKKILAPFSAEIEDVAINTKCLANCPYCYTSATKNGKNFKDIIIKAQEVWGTRTENERPFQIAIGGAGEATMHPLFADFVRTVQMMKIVPNYTTNGMHLSPEILQVTRLYCGGVAVSYHPHIRKVFIEAIYKLRTITRLNVHIIVGDRDSLQSLKDIYEQYKDQLEYFVVLPYQAVGRGIPIETHETWVQTFDWISKLPEERQKQFAFGALFYEWMLQNKLPLKIDIYEPEIYSGYRIFDDSYKMLRKSSYDLTEKHCNNKN